MICRSEVENLACVQPNMLVVDVERLAANNVMLPNFVPERSTVPLTASVDNKQFTPIAIVHIEILSAKQLRAADRNGMYRSLCAYAPVKIKLCFVTI